MGNMTTLQILQGIKTWVTTKLNLKQDVINDLANIRSGAQAGSTAIQPADLSAYFNDASYDNNAHRINFYHGQTVVAYVDASPFIVDGMVDDVRIENGYLVIDFNTASGKQDISIPLTDIFNPNNYYNKTQADGLLAQKQDVIQDLTDIRSGASAGSTAVQPSTLNNAVKNVVAESGVYDVSANNDNTKFESLSALLSSANLNTLIPTDIRKGGMSIKFVLSSDNKYVRYNLLADEFSTDVEDWEEDASIEKLESGDIIPKLAQNLESWEGREDLTVNSTWSEPVRTTAGDASIVSSKGGKIVSIVPRSDFYASALKATGFNLLRNAVQIGTTTKYYFLAPKLIFGTFGTADEPNGVLFTNAQGEKMTPTVYFKKLSDGVPTSSSYGSACTYTTSNGYRFYTCSEIGYMVVDGVTLASTCAHIAWSRRYDEYKAIDAAGDAGSSISLAAIFTALHAANQPALFITNEVRDFIEFTNTTAVWHRVCNKTTVSTWTNTEIPSEGDGASTYIHSASISGIKSGGVARIGSTMLTVEGTTVSFTDSNATAAAADVVYELATQASGTVSITPTYTLEDWGLEYLEGATGTAEVTTQYCRNYPDSLAALAQFDFKDLSLVVGEALAELFYDIQGIKSNMKRYTEMIDEYGYPMRMGQKVFDLTDGAPTEIPMSLGLVRLDASTGHLWVSKALSISTSDWKQVQ